MRKGKKNPAARAGQNQVNFDKENLVQEVKNMKDGGKDKLDAGEYVIGEFVVPKRCRNYVSKSKGTLQEMEFAVSARKIPLSEIREREL
ncbi:unnamed protein product [Porites evermanni]|uniref:Uncharacterized protein n=1 Tax=Porites evermanni TaxID=104178 RepID=A0ABN8LQE4_9CNID|nr:unnamed protein product [Porites evermanni]